MASRGLDLPLVDRIVQFNAPITPTDYVHRVGRTARVGQKGEATLFLTPHEAMFIVKLQDHSIMWDLNIIISIYITLKFKTQ